MYEQAQNDVKFDFKVFYTFGPNLVILQATTIPEGQNWPRVKMKHAKKKYAGLYLIFYVDVEIH